VFRQRGILGSDPVLFQTSGVIPAATYQILVSADFGVPNLPNGINLRASSGSFADLSFTAQVPEANVLIALGVVASSATLRRARALASV
jgi:hypothetical protein